MKKTQTLNDKDYMHLVLALAKKGGNDVRPNPLVGCIIVKNNKIIAQGYHHFFGGPHAEIYALRKAKKNSKDATMYVNLEPCCHTGKTPPCTEAIIKSGIKNIVIAMKDPYLLVKGAGIEKLKAHGINVKVGILENESKQLNKYYITRIHKQKPFVILKAAQTIDGKIATSSGESRWITNDSSRKFVHQIRSRVDAILVGINTVIRDNPSLTVNLPGLTKKPSRVILDSRLRIPMNAKVLNADAATIIATTEYAPKTKLHSLQKKGIKVLVCKADNKQINLNDLIKELTKLNIFSIMIEGGGQVNASALKSGIVDKVMFFIAPKIFGGKNAPTSVDGNGIDNIGNALKLKDIKIRKFGEDILVEGYL